MAKVKICGLWRKEDILYANEAKPDFIGFVFAKSKRQVTADTAKKLKAQLDPHIRSVGVFVNEPIKNILELVHDGTIDWIQLHGQEAEEDIRFLKKETDCPIIKAVGVATREDLQTYQKSSVDYLLFDGKVAGSGNPFDWTLYNGSEKPFFIAGGIDKGNSKKAIQLLQPFAIDVSSGVEVNGVKDKEQMIELVRSVK